MKKLIFIFLFIVLITVYLFYGSSGDIILKLRLPRLLIGLLVGAGLSVSGAVFQALLRNPLAEPYTLGISGMVVLFVNLNSFCFFPNSFAAIFGAITAVTIIYAFIKRNQYSMTQVILIGIVLNILSISLVEFLSNFMKQSKFFASKFWLMGTLASLPVAWELPIIFVAIVVITSIIIFYKQAKTLDILSLGEREAVYLGVNVKSKQKLFFLVASIMAGVCVAYTGIIGFVGLMIPHIVRFFSGPKHKNLILGSSFLGAGYLVFSDFLAKNIFYPTEISVGVITGIFGSVFFFYLVFRKSEK